jgi:hypothetical protein
MSTVFKKGAMGSIRIFTDSRETEHLKAEIGLLNKSVKWFGDRIGTLEKKVTALENGRKKK